MTSPYIYCFPKSQLVLNPAWRGSLYPPYFVRRIKDGSSCTDAVLGTCRIRLSYLSCLLPSGSLLTHLLFPRNEYSVPLQKWAMLNVFQLVFINSWYLVGTMRSLNELCLLVSLVSLFIAHSPEWELVIGPGTWRMLERPAHWAVPHSLLTGFNGPAFFEGASFY